MTQAKVTSTEYYCDDYDYAAEECDGSYEVEDRFTLEFDRAEVVAAGEGSFEYDHPFLRDFDGVGRLKAMGPLYITGAVLAGVTALGLGLSVFVRFPLNVVFAAMAVAVVALMVIGMSLGLSGAEVVEANLDRDAQNRLIDSYITQVGTR